MEKSPHPAQSQDIGNTLSQDMGYTFAFVSPVLLGHVKGSSSSGATAGVCEVGFGGPTRHVAIVSEVQIQPQVRLQMEEALRARWMPWALRPEEPALHLAKANKSQMVDPNCAFASGPSQLGKSQTAGWITQEISRSTSSCGPYDWPVSEKDETGSASTPTYSPGPTEKTWSTDRSSSEQSGMDRGFQRLVPNTRWPTSGAIDGAGFVQSQCAEHSVIARSKMGAGAADLSETVPKVRLPIGDPNGQRQSVWKHRPSRALAVECLVDRAGHPSGVHCARSSRTEWRARADASGPQGGNNQAKFAECAGSTTAHRSMGLQLRQDSSPRSFGPAASRGSLSAQAPRGEEAALELCAPLGTPSGSKQRSNQMARADALRRGSLCWIQGGPQAHPGQPMPSLLWTFADWGAVGIRRGCYASRQVYSEVVRSAKCTIREHPSGCLRQNQNASYRILESRFCAGQRVGTELMMQLRQFSVRHNVLPPGPPCGMPSDWAPTRTMESANWSSKSRFPSALSQSPTIPSSRFAGGTSAAASRQERRNQQTTTQKCNPCPGSKCYPCLVPLPPQPLSLRERVAVRPGEGRFKCRFLGTSCARAMGQ